MADVLVALRVMPKSLDVNLDKLEESIKEAVKPDRIQRKPIAFGIVAFNIIKIVPDESGEIDRLENKLKAIDAVGEVEVTEVTRTI